MLGSEKLLSRGWTGRSGIKHLGPCCTAHGLHLGAPLPRLLGGAAVAPRDDFRPRRKPPSAGPCRLGRRASALSAFSAVGGSFPPEFPDGPGYFATTRPSLRPSAPRPSSAFLFACAVITVHPIYPRHAFSFLWVRAESGSAPIGGICGSIVGPSLPTEKPPREPGALPRRCRRRR